MPLNCQDLFHTYQNLILTSFFSDSFFLILIVHRKTTQNEYQPDKRDR